jgi:hypothetical protein
MARVSPATLEKYLTGINYPCSRQELVNHARHQNAPQDVIQTLQNLPRDKFNSPVDISRAVGEMT